MAFYLNNKNSTKTLVYFFMLIYIEVLIMIVAREQNKTTESVEDVLT